MLCGVREKELVMVIVVFYLFYLLLSFSITMKAYFLYDLKLSLTLLCGVGKCGKALTIAMESLELLLVS